MPVYGAGRNVRNWLHVEDHARGLALMVERRTVGKTYNIWARNERTNIQVVKAIFAMDEIEPSSSNAARERLVTYVSDRPGHDQRYTIDPSKIERARQRLPGAKARRRM